MRSLFLTGASGFVGRRLLARIAPGRYDRIIALSRSPQPDVPGVTWVRGELRDPAPWKQHLDAGTDVAHLAAATGAAGAAEHRAVNAQGTETLVRAAERAKAGGVLLVSSIAARFTPDPRYPYAIAKREGEVVVRAGAQPFSIVRPTMVLGPGSPILDKLRALAGGPVVAVIGNGLARVQPIHVEDLATALARILDQRTFDGATLELGGPEVLTMEKLLLRVRAALGKPPARLVHVPYKPMRGGLIVLETLLGARSPVTPGQLNSFVEHGDAEPNPFWEAMKPHLLPVDRMVEPVPGG